MPKKIVGKKAASKSASKSAIKKVKKAPAKKAVKKVVKKASAKKVAAKKAPAKKAAPAKRSPNIVKPSLAKSAKKVVGKPFPAKLQSTTKGNSTTITVTPNEVAVTEVLVEERRLTMLPPPRPLKAMRSELSKDLIRLRAELAEVESGMEDLINAEGMGAGDDQADAGTKTFEREHEMSLVYNARDMVIQTERALERIDNKTYGRCEECENSIGKARLQVFPRATLCMSCKQKEERR